MPPLTLLKVEALPQVLGDMQVKVDAAQSAAGQASGAASQAAQDRSVSEASAALAADRAASAALSKSQAETLVMAGGKIYATVSEGLAASADGAVFVVAQTGNVVLATYRRDAGPVATFLSMIPSYASQSMRALEAEFLANCRRVKITVDDSSGYTPRTINAQGKILSVAPSPAVAGKLSMTDQEKNFLASSRFVYYTHTGAAKDTPTKINAKGQVIATLGSGSPSSGYPAVLPVVAADGQSNAGGQSDNGTPLAYGTFVDSRLLTLYAGGLTNIWQGDPSNAQLLPAAITEVGPLVPQVAPGGGASTSGIEAVARAMLDDGYEKVLVWNNGQGGQPIENLLNGAPAGSYAAANFRARLQRARELIPASTKLIMTFCEYDQGENNTSETQLWALHAQMRNERQADLLAYWGQTEQMIALTYQPASWTSNSEGVESLFNGARAAGGIGPLYCALPTYQFPFSPPYLHQSVEGQRRRGLASRLIWMRILAEGYWLPPHIASAHVTGANTITAILSEPVVIDTLFDAVVAPVANHGVTLTGGDVSSVALSADGLTMTITTLGAASAVTEVKAGLTGQSSGGRTADRIPRTKLRARRFLGAMRDGTPVPAFMAMHRTIIS